MKVDPFAPQLLIDYTYFCDRFGPLPFGDFVAMWHAADALMQAAADVGYEPHEVPDLLITPPANPRMVFIQATVACIRPNVRRMHSRGNHAYWADDEDAIRTLVSRMLARAGFNLVAASDGQHAIDGCRSGPQPLSSRPSLASAAGSL